MDIRQQLMRLLALTDEARRHARELDASRAEAASELDAAEYDLKRLIEEIGDLLADAGKPDEAPAEPRRSTG